uniref:Myb/SANT-like DNA-binding domain-containing protein n=1 Tax=Anopheles marajoara TaxID=58244 RepID=A0A2M4BW21_9DIPT
MARRNVWTYEETKELLSVIKDKGLIRHFGEEQNKKLYGIAEAEMRKRGFPDKGAFQIEHKWKNLKRVYYKTKREDYLSESCEFFEELDELMSERLQQNQAKQDAAVSPRRPKPVLVHFDKLLAKIGVIERENNEEFFRKQKDLINYEFELYTQDERQFSQRLSSVLEKNAEDFCFRAQQILILEGMIPGTVAEVEEEKLDMVEETMDDGTTAEEALEESIEDVDAAGDHHQLVDVIEQLEEEQVEMVEMVEEDVLEEDEENETDEKKEVVKQYYQAWKEDEF